MNWIASDRRKVIFIDESRVALEPDRNSVRVWKKQGTCKSGQNHHAFHSGNMVWAGISFGHNTNLFIYRHGSVTVVLYQDEILDPIIKLYATASCPSSILMDIVRFP